MGYEDAKLLSIAEALDDVQSLAGPAIDVPAWLPLRVQVSGLYVGAARGLTHAPLADFTPTPDGPSPQPAGSVGLPFPSAPLPFPVGGIPLPDRIPLFIAEEVRLDVDGRYPQMTVSGTVKPRFARGLDWIASLSRTGVDVWRGPIWYKDGNASLLPHTEVEVRALRSFFPAGRKLTLTFRSGTVREVSREYAWKSASFHKVQLEYDAVQGAHPVFSIATHAHPNRPSTLPSEALTIETVFARSGFEVSKGVDSIIPITDAGLDARWSDSEMHDAMIAHWSRFQDAPQWALWVLFAAMHEQGTSLGGIMFDDIGPNHRQGTAIFTDSFIANPPANDAAPDAWVARMRFWTAVHEMGHSFNLAHSWQKALGTQWVPLANEPEARSFMNYPYYVGGGQTAFFADFGFRFSNQELLFMRHAPERFVQMGNADWFDHHGFEQAAVSPEPTLALEVRVNRARPEFEFLEPVVIELKVKNATSQPILVDANLLSGGEGLTLIIKKHGNPARQWHPFAKACLQPEVRVLQPGEAIYQSIFAGVGTNGWDLAEPGRYTIQACLTRDGEDVVSKPLALRIAPPRGHDEEYLAQDVFTEAVGRVLAFDGSRELVEASAALREVTAKLPGRKIAMHAQVALGMPLRRPGKVLAAADGGWVVAGAQAEPEEAKALLHEALMKKETAAAESLGHIDYHYYVDQFAKWLADQGEVTEARRVLGELEKTLALRNVKPAVLESIRAKREALRRPARG
jgi:hypothetical protein